MGRLLVGETTVMLLAVVGDWLKLFEDHGHSALRRRLSSAFQRNREVQGATFLVVKEQHHETNVTLQYAPLLHAKDGLLLTEQSFLSHQ